jgi:hypothetical protein
MLSIVSHFQRFLSQLLLGCLDIEREAVSFANEILALPVISLRNSRSVLFVNIDILPLDVPLIWMGPSRSVKQYTLHTVVEKKVCVFRRCYAAMEGGSAFDSFLSHGRGGQIGIRWS